MKVIILLFVFALFGIAYEIRHAMDYDPRWDEPLRKEDDDHEP